MKNKKLISAIVALILAIIGAVCTGVTHSDSVKPSPSTEKTVTQSRTVKGEAYTYNIPEATEISSGNTYTFKYKSNLDEHYKKHKADTHTSSKAEYLSRANYVINNKKSLHKKEKEDGDYVYYLVSTNELVILSKDGYIRTYFCPDSGKKYYDKQ